MRLLQQITSAAPEAFYQCVCVFSIRLGSACIRARGVYSILCIQIPGVYAALFEKVDACVCVCECEACVNVKRV